MNPLRLLCTARRAPWVRLLGVLAVVGVVALVLFGQVSLGEARPGGGDTYSGGGGHGGGGDGGDGGALMIDLLMLVLHLCIEVPHIGLPLLAAGAVAFVYLSYKRKANADWDSGPAHTLESADDISGLVRLDAEFSRVLFEDFVFRLYAAAHRAAGQGGAALDALAPYVSERARAALAAQAAGAPVHAVVIGAMRVVRAHVPREPMDEAGAPAMARLVVQFEANVTRGAAGNLQTMFVVETWTLARAATAQTKPPRADKIFPCPNCGAPWQAAASGGQTCAFCGEAVDNGRFDWLVEEVALVSADARPPTLRGTTPERGTDLPSYLQAGFEDSFARLVADDPQVSFANINARLDLIYRELNHAWSAGDLTPARGVMSDGLYDSFQYWMVAYEAQGLRNTLVDMTITNRQPCKLVRDKHYDALTIRIWGSGRDFTIVRATGKVVGGSKHKPRAYSEYWTLIRAAGRRGEPKRELQCGNCGAPLKVTMAGACAHCNAHVTAGEFDWVLSKIEQDDSYRG